MADHNELGKLGEELARKHLRGKGYQILEVNWYHGRDEIDIIARDGEALVIVEVKTRATADFGEPEFAVNRRKQRTLVRAAEAYIQEKDLDIETRFDIVSVIVTPKEKHIHHIEDAFYPTM
ncbi:MAG: YraN family protein [Bacteroidales bacterium]|jgi:putative endonuclease|nr:YraN family protein [Bacteroidales bacterium]MDN5350182.1 putative endonuclease [Bacteroidales bacterium]